MAASRPPIPRLMLVTDRHRANRPLLELIDLAVAGGVDAVQIREKDLTPKAVQDLARDVLCVCAGRATVLLNGSPEIAHDVGIGLHLPENSLAYCHPAPDRSLGEAVRLSRGLQPPATAGCPPLIGRSVHSPESAAGNDSLDYLLAGHVFPTQSKPSLSPLGPHGLAAIVRATDLPVLAIGGITAENVPEAIAAGAAGVAVIGAIVEAADPRAAASSLRDALHAALDPAHGDNMTPETNTALQIVLNGKETTLPAGSTITDFLQEKGLQNRLVVVEINGAIVPRTAFASTHFADGDRVEIVHFVGGG